MVATAPVRQRQFNPEKRVPPLRPEARPMGALRQASIPEKVALGSPRSNTSPIQDMRSPARGSPKAVDFSRADAKTPRPAGGAPRPSKPASKIDDPILFQRYFKSVGPRTYAAQLKEAKNGNHYLVFTEGKRDDKTSEVRKTRLFLFSEDFTQFFRLLKETAEFVKANPVSDKVRARQMKRWSKPARETSTPLAPAS